MEKERLQNQLLALRCRRNDKAAWHELTRAFERRLLYYLRRLTGSEEEAWDALQETWIKVFRQIDTLRQPDALTTWLYRIARTTALNRMRQTSKHFEVLTDEIEREEITSEDADIQSFADSFVLHQTLSSLPLVYREVLTLFFLEEMTSKEMSIVLECPEGTIKARLHRAKKMMSERLKEAEVDYVRSK